MKTRAVSFATIACAMLGCWLPSLWLPPPAAKKVRFSLRQPAAHEQAWQSLQTKVRSAHSGMAQFQAVVAGVRGRGASLAFHAGDMADLACEEAEELAKRLAGEQLASNVTDGAAFLKSLGECDNNIRDAALQAWADADPDAALTALIMRPNDRYSNDTDKIQRLAARDPDKALAILKSAPRGPDRSEAWSAVLAACAEKGTDYALAAIQSAPRDAQRGGMSSLLKNMAAKDPRAALAWREALPPELRSLAHVDVILEKWGQTDPAAAFSEWMTTPGTGPGSAGSRLVAAWAAKDTEAVCQWIAGQSESGRPFIQAAISGMTAKNPQRALAMLAYLSPDNRSQSLANIFVSWAQRDDAAALASARALVGADRSNALSAVVPFLTTLSPDERRALAQELGPETPDGFSVLWSVDRDEAAEAFTSMPLDFQFRSYGRVAYELNRDSPDIAASLLGSVIQHMPATVSESDEVSSNDLPRSVAELTSTWARRDPAAAAVWVSQLPPGDSQATAAANLTLTWGRYDLPAAKAWVEQLPPGTARDKAGEQLTNLLSASGE